MKKPRPAFSLANRGTQSTVQRLIPFSLRTSFTSAEKPELWPWLPLMEPRPELLPVPEFRSPPEATQADPE